MCGRAYQTYSDEELYFQYLSRHPAKLFAVKPNYNMCPTQISPVLRMIDGDRQFDEMHWQLIPKWEREFKTKISTINAKSETVFESRLYKGLVTRQRCVLPINGFFEWKKEGTAKRPFRIHLQDQSIMSVAGLWDRWRPDTPEERLSFTVLTTAANDFMGGIHDRMPVILGGPDLDEWLDPEVHEPEALRKLLRPCPNEWLNAVEVSKLVNSPKNNSQEVLCSVENLPTESPSMLF